MSLQYIFGYGSTVISLIFVGHLGTFEMSAAVLGTSFSNVSGFALMVGLSSALETLCGQVCATSMLPSASLSVTTVLGCDPTTPFDADP